MRIVLLSLLLSGLSASVMAKPAAPAGDWTRTVTASPAGGHVIGKPNAAHTIIAFASYTCPHCAAFERDGMQPLLAGWVRPGSLALEIRTMIRDRYDLTAAMLTRCGGPARFPALHRAVFAAQPQWIAKIQAYETAPSSLPDTASQTQVMQDIAERTGLFALMHKHGLSPARAKACLANAGAMKTLVALTRDAIHKTGVTGTPSFVIDGTLTTAHDWSTLRDQLPGARPTGTT